MPTSPAADSTYRGRFAPSPTGPLHAGSLVAALASWLDARAHGGSWLLRMEDVDTPRCVPGMAEHIVGQLAACGLVADEPMWVQSERGAAYGQALQALFEQGKVYPCACSRTDIETVMTARGLSRPRFGEWVYPGTCREGTQGRPGRTTRFGANGEVKWFDRRLGPQAQDVASAVGDFVLKRADGLWAYQLAVVVDDAAQGISHVVRGEDLADNTARQILLQQALGLPTPSYMHVALVLGADGHKLSKQNGALALDVTQPLVALQAAGAVLGLPALSATGCADWLAQAVPAWAGIIAGFDKTWTTP
jgi:glutamyl-Q tRNA(Asp) synthetase